MEYLSTKPTPPYSKKIDKPLLHYAPKRSVNTEYKKYAKQGKFLSLNNDTRNTT